MRKRLIEEIDAADPVLDALLAPEPEPERPVSNRQARENQQLAGMKLEREAMAHRFATMAENDHARWTAAETLRRHDETIARFEQMLRGER